VAEVRHAPSASTSPFRKTLCGKSTPMPSATASRAQDFSSQPPDARWKWSSDAIQTEGAYPGATALRPEQNRSPSRQAGLAHGAVKHRLPVLG
jgi:hypothetical protein